jgi:hypothetical protein
MVLFYNRLIDSNNKNTKGGIHSHDTSPMLYHGRDKTHDDKNSNIKSGVSMPSSLNQDQNRQRMIHNLIDLFRPKTYYMMIFILSSCNLGNNWDSTPYWMVLCCRHDIAAVRYK